MDLKAIQYVKEIVRCGSMTKAAENLFLSQSALSQYVCKLEKSLNVMLFNRNGHQLSLTPEGTVFLREGSNILEAYENMCHHITERSREQSKTVRIGISEFYGQFILPKLFPIMKEEDPLTEIRLVQETSNVLTDLVKEHVLDFCVSPYAERIDGLSFEFLCTEEIMIAVPSDCPVLSQAVNSNEFPSLDIRALKEYPFILMKKGQLFEKMEYEICSSAGFEPKITCELTGWNAIKSLVAAKLGVAFLPKEMAENSVDSEVVFCHIISPIVPTRSITICTAKGQVLSPSAQCVIQAIKRITTESDFFSCQKPPR